MLKQSAGWAAATLAAAFVAGGLVAWGLTAHYGGGWRRGRAGMGPPAARIQHYLARELDLTAAQRDSVQAILERGRPKLEAIWRDVRPRFDSVRTAIDSEIATQLTPSQRTRFEEIRRRMEERLQRGRNREGTQRP